MVSRMAEEIAEQYWHVIVTPSVEKRKEDSEDALALDKDREWVESRVLAKRRAGEPITIGGRVFEWDEVSRIRITVSEVSTARLIEQLKVEDRNANVLNLAGSNQRRAADRARDVTDDLIEGSPGASAESGPAPARVDRKTVMVVYGRDSGARRATFDFLRALSLQPLEWGKLVTETGKAAPYIGEVLDAAFERAAAVVVLFTPDDEARLRDALLTDTDPEHERELTAQARPNVLFEAGMAFGVHPDRTVLVQLGELRPFSDVFGRHVVKLDGTEQPLRDIARRLDTAGCDLDDSGDDWLWAQRFPAR